LFACLVLDLFTGILVGCMESGSHNMCVRAYVPRELVSQGL
jgi:hypothetical protein